MKTINIILLIIFIIIILAVLVYFLNRFLKDKLDTYILRLNTTKDEIESLMLKKIELINSMIDFVIKKYKIESKAFDKFNNISLESIDTFKDEKLLDKAFKEILSIKSDKKAPRESKALKEFNNNIEDYLEIELKIISLRTFYNKYVLEYNSVIKKFPFSIISRCTNQSLISLLEGRELDNNFNNDLEV